MRLNSYQYELETPVEESSIGSLVISVDLQPSEVVTQLEVVRKMNETGVRVIALFEQLRVPATWGVAEPAESSFVSQLKSSCEDHEIALLGEPSWVGKDAGRGPFARELARRLAQASAYGMQTTSILPRGVLVDDHLDLIMKHGITAVRGLVDVKGRSSKPAMPHPLHFGLWELPAALSLPGESTWLPGGGRGRKAHKGISHAAKQGDVHHLVIDIPAIAQMGPAAERVLAGVLRKAVKLRDDGKLEILTLCEVARALAAKTAEKPHRNILRPTA